MKFVDQKLADACINRYAEQYQGNKSKMTTSVSFDSKKLAAWAKKVSERCATIHVRFGTYTKEYAMGKASEGRTTVFFCACDEDGNPATDEEGNAIPPVNFGEPHP